MDIMYSLHVLNYTKFINTEFSYGHHHDMEGVPDQDTHLLHGHYYVFQFFAINFMKFLDHTVLIICNTYFSYVTP
jgi:hypothetical protein